MQRDKTLYDPERTLRKPLDSYPLNPLLQKGRESKPSSQLDSRTTSSRVLRMFSKLSWEMT